MRIVLLDRLSGWLGTFEDRAMQRNRDRLRTDTGRRRGPTGPRAAAIWLLMLIWPMHQALTAPGGPEWWAVGGLALFVGMHIAVLACRPRGRIRLLRYALLPPFVALGLLLEYHFGTSSGYLMMVFSSQAVAMVLPVVAPGFIGVLVVTALGMLVVSSAGFGAMVGLGLAAFLSGFVVCILRRMFTTIDLLRQAREDLATAAVADERLRFSRDLHDLLGHTLSVIVVKAEVVRRLAERDTASAAEAARDIETIGRQALVEVREAVTGYRASSLADELDGARAALHDAGIDAAVHRASGPLPERVESLLGWAVREASTNVIRHSGAGRCSIRLDFRAGDAVLRVHDDGVGAAASPTAGHGLRGLSERFAADGGTVHAGPDADGFTLTAAVATDGHGSADKMCP